MRLSKKKWTLKILPELFHDGRAFLCNACCKANVRSCCTWKLNCISALSGRKKRLPPSVMQCAEAAQDFRTSASPSAPLSFLAQPVLERQSLQKRLLNFFSMIQIP